MKKTNKRNWRFQNPYTKEDMTLYPLITERTAKLLEQCGFTVHEKRNIKNRQKRQTAILGVCPECKQPMSYCDGSNIAVCTNPECKGTPYTITEDDEEMTLYHPTVYKELHINSQAYLEKLFN